MILVFYFVVGVILGSLDFYFVVNLGALFWMDLYFVESLSLQNHLSAPWPEMSKGILLCGHAICAIRPYCRVQAKPNWAKTTRRLWSASTTWQGSSKPRGVWRMPSLFTVRLSRRAREPSFKDFNGTLASGSGVIPYWTFVG